MNDNAYPDIRQSVMIFFLIVLLMIVSEIIFGFVKNLSLNHLLSGLFVNGSTLIIIYHICKKETGKVGFCIGNPHWKMLPFMIVAVFSCLFITVFEPDFLVPFSDKSVSEMLMEKPDIYLFLATVVVAPVLEELIFRGIMLDGLLKQYTPVKSILFSSLLFMLFHPYFMFGSFILSAFLGWIYYRGKSLIPGIIMHILINLRGFSARFYVIHFNIDITKEDIPEWGIYDDLTSNLIVLGALVLVLAVCIFVLNRYFNKRDKLQKVENKL